MQQCNNLMPQVLDAYLRDRAKKNGAKVYNGLFLRTIQKDGPEGAFTVNFSDYTDGGKVQKCVKAHCTEHLPTPLSQSRGCEMLQIMAEAMTC